MANEDVIVGASLVPAHVAGESPGAVYHVIARTASGYVAIRRIAERVVRIRAERFDRKSFASGLAQKDLQALIHLQFKITGENGSRVSVTCHVAMGHALAVGVLTQALYWLEDDYTKLPIQAEPSAQEFQDQFEKAHMAQVVADSEENQEENQDDQFVPLTPKNSGPSDPNAN